MVPMTLPGLISLTLTEMTVDDGVLPLRGATRIHGAPVAADHDRDSDPEDKTLSNCSGGFDPPWTATKLSSVGVTLSVGAAWPDRATIPSAMTTPEKRAIVRE